MTGRLVRIMAGMADAVDPGAGPRWGDAMDGAGPAPAMPLIRSFEQYVGAPYPVQDGASPTLGWQWRTERKGGPVFALISRNLVGTYKIQQTFPLTEAGWAEAWDVLARLSPDRAAEARQVLAERAAADRARQEAAGETPELIALDVESLAPVRGVTLLGGYAPDVDMLVGHTYDIRFREERLAVYRHRRPDLVIELPYPPASRAPRPAGRCGEPVRIMTEQAWLTAAGVLEVMPTAAYGVADAAEDGQDDADQQQDDADGPRNGDLGDESDDEKDEAEHNHGWLLGASWGARLPRPA